MFWSCFIRYTNFKLSYFPDELQFSVIILCSCILWSCDKHWINEYWTIAPRVKIGLDSCEPLVTAFSSYQYIILFCVCVLTVLLNVCCWFIDIELTVRTLNSCLNKDCLMYFFCKEYYILLVLRNTTQYFIIRLENTF